MTTSRRKAVCSLRSRMNRILWYSFFYILLNLQLGWSFPIKSFGSAVSLSRPLYLSEDRLEAKPKLMTTALLRISYDGTRFTGWSASNEGGNEIQCVQSKSSQRRTRRRRREGTTNDDPLPKGFVRSVEGVIRDNLAKIYGNVEPRRIVVEGCSRTDKGVNAIGMIAQIYCLKSGVLEQLDSPVDDERKVLIESSIPGKRLPHPKTPTDDSHFEPLPMNGNLSRLAFALNRMRPSDIQVTGIAPIPLPTADLTISSTLPFHPTLSCQSKRYEYRISTGAFQDPTKKGESWYVGKSLDIPKMEKGLEILVGKHNFVAFRGVPRGPGDRQKYKEGLLDDCANVCTLFRLELKKRNDPSPIYFPGVEPPIETYSLIVTGDRFLYKMMRFLVGAIVAVGIGKLNLEDLEYALETGSWEVLPDGTTSVLRHRKEFQVAPPHGLILAHVDYGPLDIDWQPLRM